MKHPALACIGSKPSPQVAGASSKEGSGQEGKLTLQRGRIRHVEHEALFLQHLQGDIHQQENAVDVIIGKLSCICEPGWDNASLPASVIPMEKLHNLWLPRGPSNSCASRILPSRPELQCSQCLVA